MGTLIMTPGTHSAFHCPGVGGKEMASTGEQAWMLGSGLYLAGMVQVCVLDPILSGSASGISLPEAAVRLIGEPQPVHLCTSCPRRVPTAWHCPGHSFLMSYSCPCMGAEQSLLLPCGVGRGAIGQGLWGSPDHQPLVVALATLGLGKLPSLGTP